MSQFYVNSNGSGLSAVDTLTGNSGGPIGVDGSNNINIIGAGGVTVSGNSSDHTLTISVSGSGFSWSDKSTSFTAVAENGYYASAALTATLPAIASQGDGVIIACDTTGAVIVQASAGQSIRIGNTISSVAGFITNTQKGDSLNLVYRAADSVWFSLATEGSWIF